MVETRPIDSPAAAAAAAYAGDAMAPPTLDNSGGKLTPVTHQPFGMLEAILTAVLLLSPVSALIYGLFFSTKSPSAFRTAVKVLSVGPLAAIIILSLMASSSFTTPSETVGWSLLAVGFTLCALGDAFLAGEPKRWLAPGLVAFLLGHLAFIILFATSPGTQAFGPLAFAAMAAVALAGGAMLAWLWRDLGSMRWPVIAYVVVIVAMVCASLTHWQHNIAWPIGALMFMASDAILAGELFKNAKLPGPPRLTAWAIWFLYYGAQLAFLAGMIGYVARY